MTLPVRQPGAAELFPWDRCPESRRLGRAQAARVTETTLGGNGLAR